MFPSFLRKLLECGRSIAKLHYAVIAMNTRILGILLGFIVVGIAFTGGAAAAPITGPITEDAPITQDVPITQSPITGPITEDVPITQSPITGPITQDVPITQSPITGPITADRPITQSPITGPITQSPITQ